ncbi:MAG: type II secretion system F family protein [Verrucomicrobia bacterium]|nr:type II secretion system F family protein [Verrucomicrobiota bacterium]
MAEFAYKATDSTGSPTTGRLAAHSRGEAYRLLRERGLQPVSVSSTDGSDSSKKSAAAAANEPLPRLNTTQLLYFTEELAELLEAGLKLEGALKVIEQRQEKSGVQPIASRLRQRVRDGFSFSAALHDCGRTFDPLYCNLVAAGEASGALPQILKRQCAYLTLIQDLRSRVVSSLLYPAIVFTSAIVLMFVFLTFLVPQLSSLLGKTGQKLPLITQVLISTSQFCGQWWWAIIAFIGLLVLLVRYAVRTPAGRDWWHQTMLSLPVVGPVLQAKFFAEMLQTLSTLVSNGVALLHGIQLMTAATANVYLKTLLVKVAGMVGEGISLASALRRVGFFPPVMMDILAVGEQTGDIAGALERAAKRYDRDLTTRIGHLTTLVQPAIILLVALFVGIVAYSMIAGILTSVSSLKTR